MTAEPTPDEPPVGTYRPRRIGRLHGNGPDTTLVERLLAVTGLSSAFSDELDGLGYRTAVPSSLLRPLRTGDVVIGRAVTLRYIASREVRAAARLAHATAWQQGRRGDVLVIEAPDAESSVLGGQAAEAAVSAGIAAVVVDGAVRDLDEIDHSGLPVWTRGRTPATGRNRFEAVEINGPVQIGTVGVEAGDVVVADRSGVVFVPADVFAPAAWRILGTLGQSPQASTVETR